MHLLACIQSLPNRIEYNGLASITKNAIGLLLVLIVKFTTRTPIALDNPLVKLVICMLVNIRSDNVLPNFLRVATGMILRIAHPSMNT